MQLADPPPSPRLTEPVVARSRCAVQQLAALGQLVAPSRCTGVIASVHAAALYHASRVCDRVSHFCGRDSHAGGRAMQAETEAGCAENDESVDSASASAAIIEEK